MVRSRRGRSGNGTDSWCSKDGAASTSSSHCVDLSPPRGTGTLELHLGRMRLSPGKAFISKGVDDTF